MIIKCFFSFFSKKRFFFRLFSDSGLNFVSENKDNNITNLKNEKIMKTKWFFLLAIALGSFTFVSCSDDDDNDGVRVSEDVKAALRVKYPNASYVEWEAKAGYYVAEFRDNGAELDAWFTPEAVWKMTETDLGVDLNKLPLVIKDAFLASEYALWSVDDIDLYEREDLTFYLVEVEKKGEKDRNLYYNELGGLLKDVEDMPNDDVLPTTTF